MALQIPKNFELFSDIWTIRAGSDKELDNNLGLCYADSQEVILNPNQTPQQLKHVLLHELIHAIEQKLNLELTESQVDGVALGIKHLFLTNPQLLGLLVQDTQNDTSTDDTENSQSTS
jgi:hypothetical protein